MADSIGEAGRSVDEWAQRDREQAGRLMESARRKEQGAEGERAVAGILAFLPPGFVVLHDLSIPGSKANVDHLVVGPTGVFAVDAKTSVGQLTEGSGTLWWKGTRRPIRSECETASWEATKMSECLGHAVRPLLCFVRASLPRPTVALSDVVVTTNTSLTSFISSEPGALTPAEVRSLVQQASHLVRRAPGSTPQRSIAARPRGQSSGPPQVPVRGRAAPSWVRIAAGVAVGLTLLVVLPAVSRMIGRSVASSTSSPVAVASTSTSMARQDPTTTSASLVDAPPTVELSCVNAGLDWTAHVAPTKYVADPVGYHVWWRTDGAASWVYWGHFSSGIAGLVDVGGLQPSAVLAVHYDRVKLEDPSAAAGQLSFAVPPGC